jgi:hypothetical protein
LFGSFERRLNDVNGALEPNVWGQTAGSAPESSFERRLNVV